MQGWWGYSSRWGTQYSIVLGGGAMLHRSHLAALRRAAPRLRDAVTRARTCEDLLLACLVARASRRPPIKLAQRTRPKMPQRDHNMLVRYNNK